MNLFYLICPIGLETALIKEIQIKGLAPGLASVKAGKGGVEIEAPFETGLALNYQLKTPTRILMRIKERRCRDFPKLFKVITQIPWRDFLVQEKVQWRISCKTSRIINTDKAQESCEKALKKYFAAAPLSKKILEQNAHMPEQKVYLRFENDDLTISLDTSGDLLHIRGGRPDRGKASLRENYAACLLTLLLDGKKEDSLIDPMCGTGTFLNEALDYFTPLNREDFPFNVWKGAPKSPESDSHEGLVKECLGLDLEPKAKERKGLEIHEQNIFEPLPMPLKEKWQDSVLICNPPYGKRVKIKGDRKSYFLSLLGRIEKEYNPKRLGIIIPADVKLHFDEVIPFNNNGIKVNFGIKARRAD